MSIISHLTSKLSQLSTEGRQSRKRTLAHIKHNLRRYTLFFFLKGTLHCQFKFLLLRLHVKKDVDSSSGVTVIPQINLN